MIPTRHLLLPRPHIINSTTVAPAYVLGPQEILPQLDFVLGSRTPVLVDPAGTGLMWSRLIRSREEKPSRSTHTHTPPPPLSQAIHPPERGSYNCFFFCFFPLLLHQRKGEGMNGTDYTHGGTPSTALASSSQIGDRESQVRQEPRQAKGGGRGGIQSWCGGKSFDTQKEEHVIERYSVLCAPCTRTTC